MNGPIKMVVAAVADVATGIRQLRLERLDGGVVEVASPGSHLDVRTHSNLTRQYSVCNGPEDSAGYTIAVKLEERSRGGSAAMHRLTPGDVLEVRGPRNLFALLPAHRYILIAGGIGITPIFSMAMHLKDRTIPFDVHYFARSAEHAAFIAQLGPDRLGEQAATRHFALDPEQTVEALRRVLARPRDGTRVYVCGPAPLMDAVRAVAARSGWSPEVVHEERFSTPTPAGGDSGFAVELARSGVTIEVGRGESLLDALLRAGVDVDFSCEQGVCGTCVTPVLDGLVDHRDSFLTEDERAAGDQMCLCVSRAACPLLRLDL